MGPEFQFMRALAGAAKFFKAAKVAFYIYAGVSAVKSWREASALMKEGQDVLATKHPAGGKLPILYGTRRVGSTIVYMDTDSGNSKELFVVYALSVGEIDDIDLGSIELNGVSIRDSKVFRQGYYAGSDKIVSGAGSLNTASQIGNVQESNAGTSGTDPTKRYRMVFNAHHGSSTQTADPMLTASITKWTTSHRLRGIAYIAASFEYDSRGMFTSTPELTVVCRGKKLYDPRLDGSISGGTGSHRIDDTSTYEWSDNAALAILDYITNTEYGKGLAASAIDMSSFQAAANITDTKVDVPDFSGSYASATYTGNSGNNYFDVDEATWKKIKGGSVITLKDSDTTTELEDAIVTDVQRYTPHTETTKYRIYTNSTLGANYSNEAGTILVKTRRFHCNGLLDADKTVLENTRTLVSNCRAFFNYLNGKFSIKIEDTGSSTFSITEDHIVDDSGITINYEDKAEKYNKVVVNFFNAQKKYEADTVTIYHDASPNYTSDDGGEELEAQAELNFVTNPYIAYNIGKAILGRSRNQKAISFTATPALFRLSVGDIVDITYSGLGLSADNYIIQSISLEANGLLNVTALEYVDIYTWDSASDAENVGDLPDLPTGLEARPPTNLTFTDSDSSSTGRPFLSWTAATNYPAKEFRVVIVDSSDNELHNRIVSNAFIDLNFIPVGSNYEASVSSINSLGSESDAATLTFSVGTEPVDTADIKDLAIVVDKVGNQAIETAKIKDAAVTYAKLNDSAIFPSTFRYDRSSATTAPSDSEFNTAFGRDPKNGDVVIVTNTSNGSQAAYIYASGAFSSIQYYLDGSLVVDGTIGADAVTANFISALQLVTETATISNSISIGTGNNIFKADSNGIYLGNATFASAPFRVTPAGALTATSATITGDLTLTNIDGTTITYSAGDLVVGTIGGSNLGDSAIFASFFRYDRASSTTAPSTSEFNTEFGRNPKDNDIVIVTRTDTNAQVAYKHNGTSFATITNFLDGDLVVDGSITATQIAAGTLTSASGVFGAISAGNITTGSLTSTNHSGTGDGSDFSTAGTKINIADGSVSSENFRISSAGDAFFRGQVTAGSGVSTVAIGADSGSNINIFAGATTPDSATFKVDSTGKVTLTSLILKTGGNTYFDENGFTDYAITQILQGTGTTVSSYGYSQSDNTSYATITTTDAVTVDLTASLDVTQILGDNSYSTSALAKAQIPEDMTLIIEVAEDDNTFGSPLHGSTSSQFTADTTGVFQPDPSDGSGVTSSEYHVSAFGFFGIYTASISSNFGAVDSNGNMSISLNNVSLSANTTYYFRFRLTTTDTNYDLENNLTIPTASRTLNIAAQSGGFVVASGGGSGSGTSADSFQRISVSGQSTIIADATNSNNLTIAAGSGIALTTNASTDTLTIAASGSPTFTDLTVTGNLTVQGTTTTLETATLNVEDKNITLNYGTGDTSASANGAGITIQDAVNSTTDATILWNTTSDEFDFSHGITIGGDTTIGGASGGKLTIAGQSINAFATTTEPSLYRTGSGGSDIFATAGNLVIQPRTSAARSVNIATSDNGTSTLKRASFASNGDISFYEDTGTTAKLFWDASAERLGIGTTSPAQELHISTGSPVIRIEDTDGGYGEISGSSGNVILRADEGNTQASSFIGFEIDTTEEMRLTSTGLDVVGGITSSGNLHVGDDTNISMDAFANGQLEVDGDGYQGAIALDGSAMHLYHNSSSRSLVLGTNETARLTIGGTGGFNFHSNNLTSVGTISSGAITSSGNVTATAFYGDGSNLTGVTSTTINNNADNRIITGSGTANTLNAESGLTYDGSTLAVTGTISSGVIDSSGTSNFDSIQLTDASTLGFGTVKSGATVGHNASVDEGIFWHTDNNYGIYRTAGAWSSPNYSQLKIKWHTGIEIDGHGTTYGKSGINFLNGNIKMDGVQILDASRNLLNIGTISSGNITSRLINNSQADTTPQGTQFANTICGEGNNRTIYFDAGTTSVSTWYGNGNNAFSAIDSTDGVLDFWINDSVGNWYNIADCSSSGFSITTGGLRMGTTQVIDSSRNFFANNYYYLNGQIMAQGNDSYLRINQSNQFGSGVWFGSSNIYNGTGTYIATGSSGGTTNSRVYMYGGTYDGSNVIALDGSDGRIKGSYYAVSGTTVIDSSRNLTNIGTGSFAGNVAVNAGSSYPLQVSSTQRYQLQIRNPNNTTYSGYGWWLAHDTNFNFALHADGAGDRFTLTRDGNASFTGTISSGAIASTGDISANSGYLIMGEAAFSVSSEYVGIKTSNQSGTSDYMIISGKTDGNTYVSAKAGSNTIIRGGANSATHQLVVSSSAATFSGTVQISAGQKLLFGGNTIYGIGAGGHNDNSGYFDTVESGVSTDVLELVYYSGTQVNIGSGGGTKPLSAGSIQITGTTVIDSSRNLTNIGTGYFSGLVSLATGTQNYNSITNDNSFGYGFHNDGTTGAYAIRRDAGAWSGTYPDIEFAGHTGIQLNANSGYDGVRFFTDYNSTTRVLQVNGASNYIFKDVWMYTDAGEGMYSSHNSAHIDPNVSGTYGSWRILGSKNSYGGFYDAYSGNNIGMYDSGGNGGEYDGSHRWITYYHVSNACLGIGGSTTSSSYGLYEQMGGIYSTGNITAYSDRRVKENIVPIDNALAKVNALQGVYYNRIDDEDKKKEIGFIAQDVNEVTPELVTYAEDVDQYGVKYGNTTALLVEAIKELTKEVEELKSKLKEK